MPEFTPRGLRYPLPGDRIKDGGEAAKLAGDIQALANTANTAMDELLGSVQEELGSALKVRRDYTALPANVDDWIGLEWEGVWVVPVATTRFTGLPSNIGVTAGFVVTIVPMGTGGSMIRVYEYAGDQTVFSRSVSNTPERVTGWKLNTPATRRVLTQMTFPGAPTLVDNEPTRHIRLPEKPMFNDYGWDITLKNYNERSGTNFGQLNFEDIWIAPRAKDSFGQYTQNFASAPVNLGKPKLLGSGTTERYRLEKVPYIREKGAEYIFAIAYTDPSPSPNHLGISGSYNGTNPAGVSSMSVSNEWSQYTPLDIYISSDAPASMPVQAMIDSSSGSGLQSNWPLRDSWVYRVGQARGVHMVNLSQSGQTTRGFATANGGIWSKLTAFDPVDMVGIASGSNDAQVYTLPEMKADFLALCDKVRSSGLSDNIMAYNFFPRATEPAAVANTRKGYDAWLFGELPGGILAAFNRAKWIVGPDGLMRPELNTDGSHVNTWGQRLMEAAVITGEVLDFTPRQIPIAHSGVSAGVMYLTREGNTVNLICEGLKFTGTGSVTLTNFIPAQHCPRGQIFGASRNYWGVDTAERYRITAAGSLAVLGVTAGTQINISETWIVP